MSGSSPSLSAPVRRRVSQIASLRPSVLIVLALAGILVIGAPGPWPFGHGAGQADVNLGPGDQFSPGSTTIHAGDTVIWHFDGNSHTVTSVGGPGAAWDSGKMSSGTYSHTFDRAGTYPYICALHAKMSGTVVVLPADTTAATPPAASTPGPAGTPAPGAAPAAGVAGQAPASATAGRPTAPAAKQPAADAAAPRLAALHVALTRGCRTGHCRAVVSLTASEPATVTVRSGARRLLAAHVAAGPQRVRVPLSGLRRGRHRLTFVLTDAAGNRSAPAARTVTVH